MKKIRKIMMILFLVIFTVSLSVVTTHAAPTLKKLSEGTMYKKYDVTRDGKKDRIQYFNTGMYSIRIYINGKNMGNFSTGKSQAGTVYHWRYSRTNNFIIIQGCSTSGTWHRAYKYLRGKLVLVYSSFGADTFSNEQIYKISKNYLYVKVNSHKWGTFSYKEGSKGMTLGFKYKAKNGKISLASRYAILKSYRYFEAGTSFRTSNALGKSNTKGVRVRKGDNVKLLEAYYGKSGKMWYKISVNGKIGWFRDSDKKLLL